MRLPKYTEEQLRETVAVSTSFRDLIARLGLVQAGGTQANLTKKCAKLQIDTSHFTGQGWTRGLQFPEKKKATLKRHLRYGTTTKTHTLRLLLIDTGTKEARCEVCNGIEWNGVPMPLELHHIDGDKKNNTLLNLQIVCPNCHAQTDNHAGKGARRRKEPAQVSSM